jgi:oxaloacetate decarboxylase beta subunit
MKNLILTALIGFGAFAVFGGGSAMEMAGKTLELADETGIAGFVQFGAPAYLTGDFADSAKPEKKPLSANRNGYWDKELKWHGGYFNEAGAFVEGHAVKTLFGMPYGLGQAIMIPLCLVLMYLAIVKGFEPLLLLPIGFGGLLANCPLSGITAPAMMHDGVISFLASGLPVMSGGIVEPGGFLHYFFKFGIDTGIFPIMIFMGVGAMTDFAPLIANPKSALLGAAAQFGIFFALFGTLGLSAIWPDLGFGVKEASAIGIIGGADGPTAIWLTSRLAPELLGAIAVAAYSYMTLVPIIQPPIMRALTTKEERLIRMPQVREVTKI